MRQLKAFMKAKKWVCSKKCECLTINMWRCADLQNDYEFCGCDEGKSADMGKTILTWFKKSPVYASLTDEQKEQALADAQEIIEWAWDSITPFYNAVKKWQTFAYYAEQEWLTVDESGNCDSSVYEDEEAFIIYIWTALGVDCKYLALVARRGITPSQELINKDAISDYLDWVTTDTVTYQFKDWDGEILKFGSIDVGGTPVAPEAPGRSWWCYEWEFTGWSPEVWPITQDTTFVAQYQEIIPISELSNLTIPDGDRWGGEAMHVYLWEWETRVWTLNYLPLNANDDSSVYFDNYCYDWDAPTINILSMENWTLTFSITAPYIDNSYEVSDHYEARFSIMAGWTRYDILNIITQKTVNCTITPTAGWSVSKQNIYLPANIGTLLYEITGNEIVFSGVWSSYAHLDASIATPNEWYTFIWFEIDWEPLPSSGEVEAEMNITARFAEIIPVTSITIPNDVTVTEWQSVTIQTTYSPANANTFSNVRFEPFGSYWEASAVTVENFNNWIVTLKVTADRQSLDPEETFDGYNLQLVFLNNERVWDFGVNLIPNRMTIPLHAEGPCTLEPANSIVVYSDCQYVVDGDNNDMSFTINGYDWEVVGYIDMTMDSYDVFLGWRATDGENPGSFITGWDSWQVSELWQWWWNWYLEAVAEASESYESYESYDDSESYD